MAPRSDVRKQRKPSGRTASGDGHGVAPEAASHAFDPAVAQPEAAMIPLARLLGRELRLRAEVLPHIDEARWMILLDVYLAMSDARETPFMSAAHASNAPVSTAQRYIHDLIENGLLAQHRSGLDQRITHVSLTIKGVEQVTQMLGKLLALRQRGQGS